MTAPVPFPGRAFAASVTRLRCERGWAKRHLAGLAGIDVATVYRLESGQGGTSFTTMWRIAEAFGVTVDAMVRGEVPAPEPKPRAERNWLGPMPEASP